MSKYYKLPKNNELNIVISKYGYGKTYHEINKLEKEIKRLNNILDELEKICIDNIKYSDVFRCTIFREYLKKIRLLRVGKGGFTHE